MRLAIRSAVLPIACWALAALSVDCSATAPSDATRAVAGTDSGGSSASSSGGSPASETGGVGGGTLGTAGASGSSGQSSGGSGAGGAGGSASAGSAGSGGSAGSSGSGPLVGCGDALFCDDFESYAPMTAPSGKWKSTTVGTGTVLVDTVHAFSGTKAVHFHGMVSQGNGGPKVQAFMLAAGAPVFPVTTTTLFVRFMVFGERFPDVTHKRMVWVGSANALSNPDRGADGQGYDIADYNGIAVERLSSGYFRNTSVHFKDAAQVGKWHCWELEIDNAGGPPPGGVGTALPHLWEDGVELKLALAGDKTVAYNAIPFEGLLFSLWSPQADTAVADYWFDDVAMATKRINCPAAP